MDIIIIIIIIIIFYYYYYLYLGRSPRGEKQKLIL